MKALAKAKGGPGLNFIDLPVPKPGFGEVLIKVKYASICGSDVHIYKWDEFAQSEITRFPRIIGHESAGEIVEIGEGVDGLKVGDFVGIETHITCGKCYQCKIGKKHVCKNLKILGFHRDGAFAEYMAIPAENVWKVSNAIPKHWVPLMEPMGNSVDTVFAGDIVGADVLVLGTGPIGAMAVAVAKAGGASKVIATDINDFRLSIAKKMGADYIINPEMESLKSAVLDITGGKGIDVLLEMSGSPNALETGLSVLTNGGWIGLLGIYGKNKIDFPMNSVIMRGITLYGITGRKMFSTWVKTSALLENGKINLEPIITHRITLDEYKDGFSAIIQGSAMKVMFEMG